MTETASAGEPAVHARLLARGRALRTVAEYQPGAASQIASPFETSMARARLDEFLAKHGLTDADLDHNPPYLTTTTGGDDWTPPKPRAPHVIHRMDGFSQSGAKGLWRAWCRCGHGTTPRVTRDRALTALRTDPAHPLEPTVCCLCGKNYTNVTGDGWMDGRDRLVVLTDTFSGDEFMVCRDGC
ncbi:hypothetical protein [Amycolatopsis sp. cmx-11-51]|uniref:hypothetical protein n=1 Tax=Amycolatopsis sp. cmx-11-51 TaxID=2785797 RepID=UPI0039E5FEFB